MNIAKELQVANTWFWVYFNDYGYIIQNSVLYNLQLNMCFAIYWRYLCAEIIPEQSKLEIKYKAIYWR